MHLVLQAKHVLQSQAVLQTLRGVDVFVIPALDIAAALLISKLGSFYHHVSISTRAWDSDVPPILADVKTCSRPIQILVVDDFVTAVQVVNLRLIPSETRSVAILTRA